jgi:hypothetical protein
MSVIDYYSGEQFWWFRVFGYGLCFYDTTKGLPFSVRHGLRRVYGLGKWLIEPLR